MESVLLFCQDVNIRRKVLKSVLYQTVYGKFKPVKEVWEQEVGMLVFDHILILQ